MTGRTPMLENFDLSSLPAAIRSLDEALKAHMVGLQSLKAVENQKIAKNSALEVEKKVTPSGPINRSDKVTVSMRMVFLKIGTIDTIHDRFSAEVLVQARWREPALDGRKMNTDAIEWDRYWTPRLKVENSINEPKCQSAYSLTYDNNGRASVCESRTFNGFFFEFMELNQFPFDAQDLTLTMVSEREASELVLVEDEYEKCGVNPSAFSSEQEWRLHHKVNSWRKINKKVVKNRTIKYPAFATAAKVSRRPQFFIWNIIVILFAICSLSFTTFTVTFTSPQTRLPLTFFLVLTTVTFKFVVNKSLPKISYLTYLDKYILGIMVIVCSVCIWHALIGSIINSKTQTVCPTTSTSTTSTTVTTTTTTTTPTMSYNDTTVTPLLVTTAPSLRNPAVTVTVTACPGVNQTAKVADYIAFGAFCGLYIVFHLIFLVLIACSKLGGDEDPNIEIDAEDEVEISNDLNRNTPTEKTVISLNKIDVMPTYQDKPNVQKIQCKPQL